MMFHWHCWHEFKKEMRQRREHGVYSPEGAGVVNYAWEEVGVENAVYPNFDRSIHVRPLEQGLRWVDGAIGVDYGRRHMSALVVVLMDQYNRRWVVEAWAAPDDEEEKPDPPFM